MGSSRKIVKGFFWTTLLNLVNGFYGFISVPILIGYFGKADYGLIGLAMSVNVYLRLMDLGFNSTNIRFFSNWLAKGEYTNVKKLFQTSLVLYGIIGLINAVLLLFVSYYSNQIFNLNDEQYVILKNLFYVLAISAIISWFTSCFEQLIKAHEYVGWMQKITLVPKILQIIILGITVLLHLTIEWYYALTTFSMFAILPVAIHKIRIIAPYISFNPILNKSIFKEILPYCLNIFSFGLFQFSINYLRPVFLGMQGTIESVSDYRILNGIITIVLMLGGAFMGIILPSASKVVALGDENAQSRIAYDGTKYISITLAFCCFGMMSVTKEVILLYVGSEYLYLNTWLDLWLLTTLFAHNQAISSLILSGRDIRAITYSTIVTSLIGLVLCWFLIPYYKVGGTVIAYGVYGLSQMLFYYLYYWRKKMRLNSSKIFKYSFLPSFIIGIVAMWVARNAFPYMYCSSNHLINFLGQGFTFILCYVSLIYLFALNSVDKAFILKQLKKNM